MPTIKVNDINIYYEIHGEGFPYVMISGSPCDVNWWIPEQIEAPSKYFKTIIFDNRGSGRTDKSVMDYSIKMIAQEIALNYPERVEKLVLCCTHCGGSKQVYPSNEIIQMMMTPRKMTPEELVNEILSLCFKDDFFKNNPDFIESYKQRILKIPISLDSYQRQVSAEMGFSTAMRLKKIEAPTLILHGTEDVLVPPKNAEILAKRIPGAKMIMLDKTAHFLFQPYPERVSIMINDFLTEKIEIEAH